MFKNQINDFLKNDACFCQGISNLIIQECVIGHGRQGSLCPWSEGCISVSVTHCVVYEIRWL